MENLKIEYAFISGLEDTEQNKQINPKSYLNLFYSDEELKKADKGQATIENILKEVEWQQNYAKECGQLK